MRRGVAIKLLPPCNFLRVWPLTSLHSTRRWCVSLRVPSVQFAAPRSQTHEDLAYASCPICGRLTHMCDMLTHLTTAHRELNPTHCRKICTARLALYEEVIGVPLKKVELTSSGRRVLDFLPTVLASGYICNWCDRKNDVYATRDKFLRHVADTHAEIDLEDVEPHVPLLPRGITDVKLTTREAPRPTRRLNGVEAVAEKCLVPPPPPPPLHNNNNNNNNNNINNNKNSISNSIPVMQHTTVIRPAGVSIPRGLDRISVVFTETELPCELCGRTFQSESDLLQHLETRHPDGTNDTPSDIDSAAIAEVAQFTAREATLAAEQKSICVVCDLCTAASRVYTTPSALFSHIRFKHSSEDAAYQVERLIRTQKAPSFVCKVCKKAFATASALDGHFSSKHVDQIETTAGQPRVAMNNCWWCHDCERGFSSAKGLHGHMQNKHGLSTQAHPCPACKRVFADVYSLEEHIIQQHKTIRLSDIGLQTHAKCSSCDRCFLSYEELHRHAVKHHKKDPRAPIRPFESSISLLGKNEIVNEIVTPDEATAAATTPQGPRKVKKPKKVSVDAETSS